MKVFKPCSLVTLSIFTLLSVKAASADLILDFSTDGTVDRFSVVEGQKIEIPVYLRQLSVNTMSPDITIDPLESFGLTGTLTGGTASFTAAIAAAPFNELDDSIVTSTTMADLVGSVFLDAGQNGAAIKLGAFTVMGKTAGDVSTLTLSDTFPSFGDFVTANALEDFDADVFGPTPFTTITTTAVPEPGSSLLIFFVTLVGLLRRSRRTASAL